MTTPLGSVDVRDRTGRRVTVARRTRETDITVTLDLDGTGTADVATGIGFYDHLLTAFAHHGLFDLEIRATGDLEVDEHHTVEDVALVLGAAVAEALGDRAGIQRYGHAVIPFDEFADAVEASRSAPELENAPGVCLISGDRILILADPEVDT